MNKTFLFYVFDEWVLCYFLHFLCVNSRTEASRFLPTENDRWFFSFVTDLNFFRSEKSSFMGNFPWNNRESCTFLGRIVSITSVFGGAKKIDVACLVIRLDRKNVKSDPFFSENFIWSRKKQHTKRYSEHKK